MNSRHATRKMRFPLLRQLRHERRQQGLGLIDIAVCIGYHKTTIGRWERGEDYPSIAALADWCQVLDLELQIAAR